MAAAATTILPSAARTSSGTAAVTALDSERLRVLRGAVFLLVVSAAALVAGDTLDVYLQDSPDAGTTYDDAIHFTQVLGNGGAKMFRATWLADLAPATAQRPLSDAAMAAGVLQGPLAPPWRFKWVIAGVSPSFTFSVLMRPLARPGA